MKIQKKNKRAVSALVATVLLILITVAAVGIIWGAIMPMLNKAMELNQACVDARLNIDTTRGWTCYDESEKQASIMISRGAGDFELAGIQIGLASGDEVKSYSVKEDINLLTNGDVELWSAGPSSAPDGWSFVQLGGGSIARNADKKLGTYSASVTKGTGGYVDVYQDFHTEKGIDYWQGRTVSLSCWVKTSIASAGAIRLKDNAGVSSATHSGSGLWESLKATRTISASATYASARCDMIIDGGTISCDGCILVEGPNPVIWEETQVYAELPNQNEAKTYKLAAGELVDIKEAEVAPIVRVGETERVCDVSSKVTIPRCV